nr:transglutaminase family protein [Burkholderia gladioli]
MKLRVGYELSYECPQPTPMMLMLHTHFSHARDIVVADILVTDPPLPISQYRDSFGNLCSRTVAPIGRVKFHTTAIINVPDVMETRPAGGRGHPVEQLPDETLIFLLGSRYCETDLLVDTAWQLFGHYAPGRETVLAICDFVHQHIEFDYGHARPTKTAWKAYRERKGVCRDFSHLGIALCRAMKREPWVEHFEWLEPLFNEKLETRDGRMIVPTRPGLGLTLSERVAGWTAQEAEFGQRG